MNIAASFQRLGFSVKALHDGTFDDMRRALLQSGRDSQQGADMAVVYFAGHGMEVSGENWLIPVDAELRSDRDAENEAISLKSAMLQAANAATLGLVVLDSCRDNPFAVRMQRVSRGRAVERGSITAAMQGWWALASNWGVRSHARSQLASKASPPSSPPRERAAAPGEASRRGDTV